MKIKFVLFLFLLTLFSSVELRPEVKERIPIIVKYNHEYVSLYDISIYTDIDQVFDVVNQKGKLFKKDHYAVYQIGYSVLIADGALYKSDYPVIRSNGEVLLPLEFFFVIAKNFIPEDRISRIENFLASNPLVSKKEKTEKEPIAEKPIKEDNIQKIPSSSKNRERIRFVVIDAGHGGKDPGALGKNAREKDMTLNLARMLRDNLQKNLSGTKIVMTRDSDNFIELGQRTEIANRLLKKNENGIFVSIHINASVFREPSGYETYFLSQNPTNEQARSTAALENNVTVLENRDSRHYDDVEYVEALMLTTQIQRESTILANSVQNSMKKSMRKFPSNGVKKADFFVLRGALMPAVLVECGYISNPKELSELKKTEYQRKISDSIGKGITMFVNNYNNLIKK